MVASGSISLAAFPGEFVEIACNKCERKGRYRKKSLAAIHGGTVALPDLRRRIAADCPRMKNALGNDLCGAYYPALIQPNG